MASWEVELLMCVASSTKERSWRVVDRSGCLKPMLCSAVRWRMRVVMACCVWMYKRSPRGSPGGVPMVE
eukprot:11593240-Alexandrium_andersonii.AAC.1